ncbi:MAG: hypothetical protein ABSH47_02305 [Bryobacteraceae bacterium]|jgi:hypothetical protein
MPESAMISVVPLLLLGAGAVAAVVLFFSLRRETGELRRRMATLESTANDALVEFQSRLEELGERLRVAEERPVGVPGPPRSGLNPGNRAQALRMLRRGIDAATIATSLNLPRPEIELLIRVQELSAASDSTTSETPGG